MIRSASATRSSPAPVAAPADEAAAFRAIAEAGGGIAFIVSCATRSLHYLSPAAEQLLGYRADDLARALARSTPASPLAALCRGLDERLRRYAAGDASRLCVVREFDLPRPDGQTVPLRVVSTLVLDGQGVPITLAGVMHDQTEQRAQVAGQRRFASMLNHEFRTPLSTIDGAIQRLEATATDADPPTRERYRKIGAAVDRLIGMLDEYLSPDRMATVDSHKPASGIAPRQLLDEAAAQVRAAGRPVEVTDEALPANLRCDPQGMRLALKVLVDNALAFSPPGSAVALAGRTVANHVELSVRDHGAGVPAHDVQRIFDKGYRGSNAAGLPGNGLGLYMARAVLEVQGGALELVVLPVRGTLFKILMPIPIGRGKVVASREPNSDNL
jgi:two-component system, OmpR family, sensor kinase